MRRELCSGDCSRLRNPSVEVMEYPDSKLRYTYWVLRADHRGRLFVPRFLQPSISSVVSSTHSECFLMLPGLVTRALLTSLPCCADPLPYATTVN